MAKIGSCWLCREPLTNAEIITHKYGVTIICARDSTMHFLSYRGLLR